MSKRSVARQVKLEQRRSENKMAKGQKGSLDFSHNTHWDDVEQIYQQCANLLAGHVNIIAGLTPEIQACIENTDSFVQDVRLLTSDLTNLNKELTQLHDQHATKKGGSTGPDDAFLSMGISNQYAAFMERHEAVVMPTVWRIIEAIEQAEMKLMRLQVKELENTPEQTETIVVDEQ